MVENFSTHPMVLDCLLRIDDVRKKQGLSVNPKHQTRFTLLECNIYIFQYM